MIQTFHAFRARSAYSKRTMERASEDFFVAETAEWNVVLALHVVLQYSCEEFRIYVIIQRATCSDFDYYDFHTFLQFIFVIACPIFTFHIHFIYIPSAITLFSHISFYCIIISNLRKNMWEPPTLNQALADQRGPWQFQRPLVREPLATTYLRHTSRQSQSRNHPILSNGSVNTLPWR
jgi:hypothetical protein